jgi:hypothetical protein
MNQLNQILATRRKIQNVPVSPLRDPIPLDTPSEWLHWIDQPVFAHEITTLCTCVNRQQLFGTQEWQATIAATSGLESTLRRRGRPLKTPEK